MTKPKQISIPAEPLLYDIDQTCARLGGIGRSTFYTEVKAGLLQTTRIGDRQFTTDEQQRAYIACKQRLPLMEQQDGPEAPTPGGGPGGGSILNYQQR